MKRLVCIELMEEHEAANFYSIRFQDEQESLFDQFVTKFSSDKEIDAIVYWMDQIGKKGSLERYFKPEGHPKVKAIPVPPPSSKLRLYCFRFSDSVLLFGGGDKKKTKTFQQDKVLHKHVLIVKKVGKKILRYLERRKIVNDGKELSGKLKFEIEL